MSKWVWVVPEEKGGIRWYSDTLWKELASHAPSGSQLLLRPSARQIAALQPSIVHIQHEYGCFGSKVPGRYWFPKFLTELRQALPSSSKIVATAHTVISSDYRYPVRGRGWQIPARAITNLALMPLLTRWWNRSTWGGLDGAVVQSSLFVDTVKNSGCAFVREIPLFVPEAEAETFGRGSDSSSTVIVFGYFSNDKGQDIVIRAMTELPDSVHLILAGGVRRSEDQAYFDHCQTLIHSLGLEKRTTITGYVADADIDRYYRSVDLVVAPFRESMGTSSVGQAFARGKAVLASDLTVNQEIVQRVPGSLEFFRSEDAHDCALKIRALLSEPQARRELSVAGLTYARKFSVTGSTQAHFKFYEDLSKFYAGTKTR